MRGAAQRGRISISEAPPNPASLRPHIRCNGVATYHGLPRGKNYLPGVGIEGKPGGRAFGQAGRASFTLYVLLGPSLAIGVALAGFPLTRDAASPAAPSGSPAPAVGSPSVTGSIPPKTLPGPAATFASATASRTATPSASPPAAAPTAPPTETTSPTIAPVPSLSAPPTPAPTKTPPLPTLPPIPTLPHGFP